MEAYKHMCIFYLFQTKISYKTNLSLKLSVISRIYGINIFSFPDYFRIFLSHYFMSWSPKFIEVSENIKYVHIHKNHYKISVNINKLRKY